MTDRLPEGPPETAAPQSMSRRFWRGMVMVSMVCTLATLVVSMLLFQGSYLGRVDEALAQLGRAVAAGYCAQQTGDVQVLADLVPDQSIRFTLIDEDGTVLYDNHVATRENHANRPEVQQALQNGTAFLTRTSATMGRETHYYAQRIETAAGTQVLRVAEEVDTTWGLTLSILPRLAVALLAILALGVWVAWYLTRRMVRPISEMAEHLDSIEADVPYEELIPLAQTVQRDRKLREDNETIRREFTANVTHELKTPLTSISGYAELIESGMAKAEDIPTFGHRIHKEAQRMIALVSDILQLSELDGMQQHNKTPELVPVDLAALVKEVAVTMTVNARKAYITLQYTVPDTPMMVRGNRDQLVELITNLCDNAIRYNRPGGHVQLRCEPGADGAPCLVVQDNGIGIPQDAQARVFERFYRVDKSRSKATGGTGLGLAIVKHIAALHDARIDLSSIVGTGTTVRVQFPKG